MHRAWRLADQLAVEILARAGFGDERPSDIDEVLQGLGVPVTPNPALPTEGRVIPTAAGPVLEFNSSRPRARQRFSKAHELSHWWLATHADDRLTAETRAAFVSEEELCDTLGAAILLPARWLAATAPVEHGSYSMHALKRCAESAGVSREAMIIRLRDLYAWPMILLTFEKTGKGWRYSGECGVRPWEYGRIRPERNVTEDHMPRAAALGGESLPPTPIGITIGGALHHVLAELAADSVAGYALLANPFTPQAASARAA